MAEQLVKEVKIVRNKSFSFLLPLFKLKEYKHIINTYLGDIKEDAFNNKLYILSSKEDYSLLKNNNYLNHYDTDDGIMYVMSIPDEYSNEYNNFLIGKYSKFSNDVKTLLCNHACRNSSKKNYETQMYSILFRTEKRKLELEEYLDVKLDEDAEYASIFNEQLEIYGN